MGERRVERCMAYHESRPVCPLLVWCNRRELTTFNVSFGSLIDMVEDIMQASVPKFVVSILDIIISFDDSSSMTTGFRSHFRRRPWFERRPYYRHTLAA